MTIEKHKCPPHHFIMDSVNIGHCKYCLKVKDFGEISKKKMLGYRAKHKPNLGVTRKG